MVIGLAFAAVVNSFVADILTPLLGLLRHSRLLARSASMVGEATIRYGGCS